MQYEPLDAGEVVQVIDWSSIALAIGAAGGSLILILAAWVVGFSLVKSLQRRMMLAAGGQDPNHLPGLSPSQLREMVDYQDNEPEHYGYSNEASDRLDEFAFEVHEIVGKYGYAGDYTINHDKLGARYDELGDEEGEAMLKRKLNGLRTRLQRAQEA